MGKIVLLQQENLGIQNHKFINSLVIRRQLAYNVGPPLSILLAWGSRPLVVVAIGTGKFKDLSNIVI